MSLDQEFQDLANEVRKGPPNPNSTNEEKLDLYKWYKQSIEGDVTGAQPWAVQNEARAKWDAWSSVKCTSKNEAKAKYIEIAKKALGK